MDQDCDDANSNGNEVNSRVVKYNMEIMVTIRVGNELLWCRKYVITIERINTKLMNIVMMLMLMAMM